MAASDLEYDGKRVSWSGKGFFKASSGLPGYQISSDQCLKDKGPIPEGTYKVFLSDHGQAKDAGQHKISWHKQ